MMDISSDGLQTLAAVVREGTFDAAAESLHLTPSAVSQRMKALEATVGRVLVQRTKPARATPDGEVLLRLAAQWDLLRLEAAADLAGEPEAGHEDPRDIPRMHLPIAANADSMSIWLLPVVAEIQRRHPVAVEILRDDESHSTGFLRAGQAVGAVTSDPRPVRGCSVLPLGAMRYLPVASVEFIEAWLPHGLRAADLARAPMVAFDRKDTIQFDLLGRLTRRHVDPPTTYVPASAEYHRAVELGVGWGAVPASQIQPALDAGTVSTLGNQHVDVQLFWQYWKLESPIVNDLTDLVQTAAGEFLL
jgi:LysR family transcriptional regulator (chromosome initiation inhibitor)